MGAASMSQSVNGSPERNELQVRRFPEHVSGERARDPKVIGVRPLSGGVKRAGSPTFACNDRWENLVELIWEDYPYCTMYGVNIVDGNIISYNNLQRSLNFRPGGASTEPKPLFDDYWRALQTLCLSVGTGRLAELEFNRGRPIAARTDEGGRRIKRLDRKSRN